MTARRVAEGEPGGARRRHPASRGADLAGALVPYGRALSRQGVPHPAVGVAALTVRGRDGRSLAAFSTALGMEESALSQVEAGLVPLAGVPAPLRVLTSIEGVHAEVVRRLGPYAVPQRDRRPAVRGTVAGPARERNPPDAT